MEQTRKGRTAGSVIGSVILSVLLLLPLTLTILHWELRDFVSEKGVRYLLDETDWSQARLSDLGIHDNQTLLESLADAIGKNLSGQAPSSSDMEKILTDPDIKDFVAGKIGEFANDFKTGSSQASVSTSELTRLIKNNWSLFSPFILAGVEPELKEAARDAVSGRLDKDLLSSIKDYSKTHTPDKKYTAMLEGLTKSGRIRTEEQGLLESFLREELLPTIYKENLAEIIPDKMTENLNTAYIRSQIPEEAAGILNTASSLLPLILLLAFCALLVLLYFVANHRVPGDAFIGIGALLVTILLPFTLSGLLYTNLHDSWLSVSGGNYLGSLLSGVFTGFHLKGNLIAFAGGLGMIIFGGIMNARRRKRYQ